MIMRTSEDMVAATAAPIAPITGTSRNSPRPSVAKAATWAIET